VTTWPHLDRAAFHGPFGSVVDALTPETEADPVALLANLMTMWGNAVGAGPHVRIGGDLHTARLFVSVVGETSRARKGSANSLARGVMAEVDPEWTTRILGGFGSGEAVVEAVRDPSDDDEGARDHRLLVREGELARVLRVVERDGSTLSPIVRDAWDGVRLAVRTRKNTVVATGTHVSVVADVTLDELRAGLSQIETANGFANRFLWVLARRARKLPSGGCIDAETFRDLAQPLKAPLFQARKVGLVHRSPEADDLWHELYKLVPDEPGIFGAVTARAEAYLLRLSLVYALADASNVVDVEHLWAAIAFWDYSAASAALIFGAVKTGDNIADRLFVAIRDAGDDGLDGTAQNELFGGHVRAARIADARAQLEELGLVETIRQPTSGRPRFVSFLAEKADLAEKARRRSLLSQLFPLFPQRGNGETP
jgi:hypothetical protein